MITRQEKLGIVLRRNVNKVVGAKELEDKLLLIWRVTGFSSARSLALYMRRYKFKKVGRKYLIRMNNIRKGEEITNAWNLYNRGGIGGSKRKSK